MHTYLEVERQESPLKRESWRFFYYERFHTLRCNYYALETRPTTRHKFRVEAEYQQHSRHGMSSPPLPEDVKAEVLKRFHESLSVTVWPEDK